MHRTDLSLNVKIDKHSSSTGSMQTFLKVLKPLLTSYVICYVCKTPGERFCNLKLKREVSLVMSFPGYSWENRQRIWSIV